jgi:hypothetical protein
VIPRTPKSIFLFYHLIHFTPSTAVHIINWPLVQKYCPYLIYDKRHDNLECSHITQHYEHDIHTTKTDLNGKVSAISQQPSVLQSTISQTFSIVTIRITGQLNVMPMVGQADFTAFICPNTKMLPHAIPKTVQCLHCLATSVIKLLVCRAYNV